MTYQIGQSIPLSELDPERRHTPHDIKLGDVLTLPAEGCTLKVEVVKGEPVGRTAMMAGRVLKILPHVPKQDPDADLP